MGRFPDFSSPLAEWKVWLARLIAVSVTLSLFGSFIWCFHLAICASTPVTLIFIPTLRVTILDSRPERRQSRPSSGSQGSKCEYIGGSKNFRGGPNTSVEFGLGVQLLWGPNTTWQAFLVLGVKLVPSHLTHAWSPEPRVSTERHTKPFLRCTCSTIIKTQ